MTKNGSSRVCRFLNVVQRIGNALPHPDTLFAGLAGIIILLSWLLRWFNQPTGWATV